MSLTPFGRDRTDEIEATRAPTPVPAPTAGGLTAFIDQGSEFEGKLSFRDTVRIDGRFHGEIASENTLIIGESGEIEATIKSNTISISGTVKGDVHAAMKVVLHKTARVEGNIQTPSIVIEEGAFVNGQIVMKTGKTSEKSTNPASLKAIDGGGMNEKKSDDKG